MERIKKITGPLSEKVRKTFSIGRKKRDTDQSNREISVSVSEIHNNKNSGETTSENKGLVKKYANIENNIKKEISGYGAATSSKENTISKEDKSSDTTTHPKIGPIEEAITGLPKIDWLKEVEKKQESSEKGKKKEYNIIPLDPIDEGKLDELKIKLDMSKSYVKEVQTFLKEDIGREKAKQFSAWVFNGYWKVATHLRDLDITHLLVDSFIEENKKKTGTELSRQRTMLEKREKKLYEIYETFKEEIEIKERIEILKRNSKKIISSSKEYIELHKNEIGYIKDIGYKHEWNKFCEYTNHFDDWDKAGYNIIEDAINKDELSEKFDELANKIMTFDKYLNYIDARLEFEKARQSINDPLTKAIDDCQSLKKDYPIVEDFESFRDFDKHIKGINDNLRRVSDLLADKDARTDVKTSEMREVARTLKGQEKELPKKRAKFEKDLREEAQSKFEELQENYNEVIDCCTNHWDKISDCFSEKEELNEFTNYLGELHQKIIDKTQLENPLDLVKDLHDLDADNKKLSTILEPTRLKIAIEAIKLIYEEAADCWNEHKDEINKCFSKEDVNDFSDLIDKVYDKIMDKTLLGKSEDLVKELKDLEADNKELSMVLERFDKYVRYVRSVKIEKLLEQLPKSRPTLRDLPKERWWTVYIDAPFHEDAQQQTDPGNLFDEQKSPGYKQTMMEALDAVFIAEGSLLHKDLDYDGYTELQRLATQHMKRYREWTRTPNGMSRDLDHPTKFTHAKLPAVPKDRSERLERIAALKELHNQRINGLPLYIEHPGFDAERQKWLIEMNNDNTDKIFQETNNHAFNAKSRKEIMDTLHITDDPQGIIMGITSTKDGRVSMLPLYSPDEGIGHAKAILKPYFEGRKVSGQSEYQRLTEIARTARALHVLHQKYDGMGRTNVFLFVNKCLVEEGFCPTVLPKGPGVFGGTKTVDGLVEDMVVGMHAFIEEVKQHYLDASAGNKNISII